MKAATFHESRHVGSESLVDATDRRPICFSTDARRAVHAIQSNPDVSLLHCPICHGYSASRMPSDEYLAEYYNSYYAGHPQKVTFAGVSRFARHIVRALPRSMSQERISILDFGGGDGSMAVAVASELLAAAPNRRIHILLVDFEKPLPLQDDRISIAHALPTEKIDGQFDVVIASAILEHIPQANAVFRSLFAALAVGGCFYARTPYVAPFTRLFPRLDLTYPAHVHDMGSGFWNRVIDVFGVTGRYLRSRPSIVESKLFDFPLRTIAAYVLKTPSHVECFFSRATSKDRFWNLVGGWEVVIQRTR
jgi:SAM-dependent methyltransferase